MKTHIKSYHYAQIKCILISVILSQFAGLSTAVFFQQCGFSRTTIDMMWFVVAILVFICSYRYSKMSGLHINGKNIYYRGLLKKTICIEEIISVKICKSVLRARGGDEYNILDRDGNQLYTMFFVKKMDFWERISPGITDNIFRTCYSDYIICSCVYDQSVIDYLLTLNPNIIVF